MRYTSSVYHKGNTNGETVEGYNKGGMKYVTTGVEILRRAHIWPWSPE